ncbi:MAG: DUF2292 domain-containing protein, partial [Papillibacter sp.]|nr:DUF2292 domain-containing protein [Papillibacter sp.]
NGKVIQVEKTEKIKLK